MGRRTQLQVIPTPDESTTKDDDPAVDRSDPFSPDLRRYGDVLMVEEAAAILRISRSSAYELARAWRFGDRNGLPVSQVGRRLRVPRSALEKVLDRPGRLYTASAPDDGGGGTDVGAKWPGTWTSDATFSAASPSIDGVTCE